MSLVRIALFEWRYQAVSLPGGMLASLLFGLGFLFTANGLEFQTTARGGNVMVNSPYVVSHLMALLGALSAVLGPSLLCSAALKDQQYRFDGLLYSTGVSKAALFFGRYLGALAALLLLFAAAPLGLYLGAYWPWAAEGTLAPNDGSLFVLAYLRFLLPTVLLLSAIIFAAARGSGSVLVGYLSAFALLALFIASSQSPALGGLYDPLMVELLSEHTGHWTAHQRNTELPEYSVDLLQHRLIWTAIAIAALGIAYRRFSLSPASIADRSRLPTELYAGDATQAPCQVSKIIPHWQAATVLRQLWLRTAFEMRQVILSWPFTLLIGVAVLLLFSALVARNAPYEVATYPLTRLMLGALQQSLTFALMVVLAFYSAEIIWRERSAKFNEIIDALPVPNWVFVLSKLAALCLILHAIVLLGIIIAVVMQWLVGYRDFQLSLYLQRGLIYFPLAYVYLAVLTCFLQTLARSRAVGLLLFFAFIGVLAVSRDLLGVDHLLLSYGLPGVPAPMSDMNPDPQIAAAGWWARLYWGSMAGLLVLLTYAFWNRGTAQPLRYRLSGLRQLAAPRLAVTATLLLLATAASAAHIFYNTNVLNRHFSDADLEQLQLEFEQGFGQYQALPMPRITEVDIRLDLFPEQRRLEVAATHQLRNQTTAPITQIHLTFPFNAEFDQIRLEGAQLRSHEPKFGYYIFDLRQPMAPGENRRLSFQAVIQQHGFANGSPDLRLVRNGSFLNNSQFTPFIGVCDCMMIRDRDDRRRLQLPPLPRVPSLEDSDKHDQNYIRSDSDFIQFQAVVSTSIDQRAIVPGTLQSEWIEGDRRYFRYAMATPMMNFYSVLSADYQRATDSWNEVDIEVLFHPAHQANVPRMIESVKDSLRYYSQAFGPYPHRQLRIVEFPAYREFAQAFPTTIPYSESLGFIADLSDPDSFDLPYYITAHEVAHQWWAHQVMAARVQGGSFLIESLAQYSALMVMEKKFGRHRLRRFLKAELDRYLSGRADDDEGETSLMRVEEQAYIHYRKGGLVMYALKEYLGEDRVNQALQQLLKAHAYQSKPYALSSDLVGYLKQQAMPPHHTLIDDWLEKITLYDLRIPQAQITRRADGRFQVELQVAAHKFYADALGAETESALDLPVDIGLFLRSPADPRFSDDDVIVLSQHPLTSGDNQISLIVDQRPIYAGVDPYNKLIDRNADDNLLELASPPGEHPGLAIGL